MKLNFENFTIAQLRVLTEEFLRQNPDFKTAEQLLEELNKRNEKKTI